MTERKKKAVKWCNVSKTANILNQCWIFFCCCCCKFQYQGESRCNLQVCRLYLYLLISMLQRNEFATSNTEHPLQQQWGFKDSVTSILETFIFIHIVGHVNIASGCTGRGSVCNHSWPIKACFWLGGGGNEMETYLLWQLLQSDEIKTLYIDKMI